MTEAEARKIINQVMVMAQKARSNLLESVVSDDDDFMKVAVEELNPELFGNVNLVDMAARMSMKDELEPIDLYNLLNMAARSHVLQIMSITYHWDPIPQLDGLPKWLAGWDEA